MSQELCQRHWIVLSGVYGYVTNDLACIYIADRQQWFLVNECMMIWSAIFMKFSLAFFFLRLVVLPWQRYFLYGSMAVTLLGNIFFFFFCLFVCGNPLNYWENFVANYCWSSEVKVASSFVHNILNCIADLMLATMPFFLLRGSSMMWRMKLGVSAILGLATMYVHVLGQLTV